MAEKAAIVVLDRHPMWLNAIRMVIEHVGIRVLAATTDPEEALGAIEEHRPELFLVDPFGHDSEWVSCIGDAIEAASGVKVVAISDSDDDRQIHEAFAAGASAYVVKTASEVDIAAALQLALTTAIHVAAPAHRAPIVPRLEAREALTRRELEILKLVADGHSNAAIGRKLWVTEQTVKFHLSNIYRKIDVRNRTAAARWASLNGLLAVDAEAETGLVAEPAA